MAKYSATKVKQKLRKEADKIWFQICIAKYGTRCEICGDEARDAHHFFAKSNYGHLRYNIQNGIMLCAKHHFKIHHAFDAEVIPRIIAIRGQIWYNKLLNKAKNKPQDFKNNIGWYRQKIDYLKEKLDFYNDKW